MKKSILVVAVLVLSPCVLLGNDNQCQEIIELERAALDRWQTGDVTGFIEIADAEVSYFDPTTTTRVDGKDAFAAHLMPSNGMIEIFRYEILNPKTLCLGDIGLLSYNINNYAETGAITSRWNASETYRRIDGEWMLYHSHFSMVETQESDE